MAVVQSEHGTGHALETNVYQFAGKTGTAVTAMDNRGYNKGNKIYQSAFMGYFPAENPRYTIAVVIQNSSLSKLVYGGSVSGPVFREVADKIYAEKIGSKSLNSLLQDSDSNALKFYGFKNDINKILSTFSYSTSGSAKIWTSAVLNNNHAALNSEFDTVTAINKVPDVTGFGLKDAIYLLENMGLKVKAKGSGKVVYQSLAQNVDFQKGQLINLQLN